MIVPDVVIQTWQFRRQQIFPGEALCGLVVQVCHAPSLQGKDCLWFVDNEAAASSLIRGSSSEADVHEIALSSSILSTSLGSRIWYEWIDSDSNLSDGLSRLGLQDPWTLSQGWELREFPVPSFLFQVNYLEDFWLKCQCAVSTL